MSLARYAWVGNRISQQDMKRLYQLKKENRKTITRMVSEAVKNYLLDSARREEEKEKNG